MSLNFIDRHFLLLYSSCHFYFPHIRSTPSLNIKIIVVVKAIYRIMFVVGTVVRHRRRWVLDMMILMVNIMTLRHFNRPPSSNHSCSSSSLISLIMVDSALSNDFHCTFISSSWSLESDVLYLPVFTSSQSSGLWIFLM